MVRANNGPRRGVVLAGVILLHAGLVAIVAIALHSQGGLHPADLVSTLIFLDEPPRPSPVAPAEDRRRPAFAAMPSTAITLPPMTQPQPEGPVDWDAESQAVGAAAASPHHSRPLDHNRASDATPAPASPSIAVHHAGEEYVDRYGDKIVWVSDRCYIASSPTPLGMPDVIARAMPTRTACRGDPDWSRPDLFKDLPAYQRYHGLEPGKP